MISKISSKITSNKQGFTLVEVVVAISILVVGILAIIQLFPIGMTANRISRQTTQANNLAQEKMEEIISFHYDDLTTGIIENRAKVDTDPQNQFYAYERQVEANLVDKNLAISQTDIGLKKITVTVWWKEKDEEKNIILRKLISEK